MDRVARMLEVARVWNADGPGDFLELLGPDVEFSPDPRFPEQGPFTGEAFRRFVEEWADAWGGSAELAVDAVSEVRDAVVARCRWIVSGASSGARATAEFTFVVWMNPDGTFDRLLAFFDHEQALAVADAGREAAG